MSIFTQKQQHIAEKIDSDITRSNWKDWKWHIKHVIREISTVKKILNIVYPEEEKLKLQETLNKFPLSITPYYLSLIDVNNYTNDPIFLQSFPSSDELIIEDYDLNDPLSEDKDSPVSHLTHRYPDRVLLHVSNVCSMY